MNGLIVISGSGVFSKEVQKYKRLLAISKYNSVPANFTSSAGASAGSIEKDDTVIVKGIRQHPLASTNSQFRYYFFILALEE